jgi:hypothetical protein
LTVRTIVAALVAMTGVYRGVHAESITNLSYDQAVTVVNNNGSGSTQSSTAVFAGDSLTNSPVTVSALVPGSGAFATATYNFYDNGSTAGFSISTSYSFLYWGYGGGSYQEGVLDGAGPVVFTTTQSLNFTMTITNSATATGYGGVGSGAILEDDTGDSYSIGGADAGSAPSVTSSISGALAADTTYNFFENTAASGEGYIESIAGNASFDLTFTPASVPEPTAFVVFLSGLPVIAFVARGAFRKAVSRPTCSS